MGLQARRTSKDLGKRRRLIDELVAGAGFEPAVSSEVRSSGVSTTSRFVVISGCSGGGKSSLIAELGRRGYPTVEESGRRIVQEELHCGGSALPWIDPRAFLDRVFALALVTMLQPLVWKDGCSSIEGWSM